MPGYPGQMTAAQYGQWRRWHFADGVRKRLTPSDFLSIVTEVAFKQLREADRRYARQCAQYGPGETVWDAAKRLHRQYGKRTKHRW